MSRLRRIEHAHRFFFITTNLARASLPLSPTERTLILQDLKTTRRSHDFLLFSYVVMPTHLHLLLYPREAMLADILRDFKCKSSFSLRKARASQRPAWQSRFFDSICRKVRDFWEKMDYIHQNPVKAGLVASATDWLWSSAATPLDHSKLQPDPRPSPLKATL